LTRAGGGLADHVAIVTGAASGIGAAIAVALGGEGAAVLVDHLDDDREVRAVCERVMKAGGRAETIRADVGDEAGVDAMFAAARDAFGTPTILVNNAGINGGETHVADMTLDRWEKTLRANLTGAFLCSRAFVRERRGKSGIGRIVNISSIHEDVVFKGSADYDASKYGLLGFAQTLAYEVAALDIRVNNVAPGMILTPMNEDAVRDPGVREERSQHIPLRRPGTPEEVARLVVYLCGDDAAYITGTSIRIDGGLGLTVGQGA